MNAIRLQVEKSLSVSDLLSEVQIHDILHSASLATTADTRRMATCLLAYMTAPDEHDQELDDLRMRVATAEVDAEQIRASRQRLATELDKTIRIMEGSGEGFTRLELNRVAAMLQTEIAKEVPG